MKEIVIANLSLDFALRIVNLYKYLCDEKSEFVMSKQLLRCGTSIGAILQKVNMLRVLLILYQNCISL